MSGLEKVGKTASALTVDLTTGTTTDFKWFDVPGTQCGNGSQTGVAVRKGTGSDLVIFMEGGGACWNELTCWTGGLTGGRIPPLALYMDGFTATQWNQQMTSAAAPVPLLKNFGTTVYGQLPDILSKNTAENNGNPYINSTIVVIPYCTGDVHVGKKIRTYGTHQTYFMGGANFATDLESIVASFPNPSRVTLMGSSAGAFGATANFKQVADKYPTKRVDVVADSGPMFNQNAVADIWPAPGAYIHPWIRDAVAAWDVANSGVIPADCTGCLQDFRKVYGYFAQHYPSSRFGLVSWDSDDFISWMYTELPYTWSYTPFPSYERELATLLRDTIGPLANVRYFVASNAWIPAYQPSLPADQQGNATLNIEHTMLRYLNTKATTNNYNLWPATPHTTKSLGTWLGQMYNDDPNWTSITGQLIQTLTSVQIAPTSRIVAPGRSYQFSPSALDQNGSPMAIQPNLTWTVSGGGTISSTGLFTATTAGGPYTVTVANGSLSASATVYVTPVTIGDDVVHSQVWAPGANMLYANLYDLPTADVVQSMSLYVDTAVGTLKMGLYSCPNGSTQGWLVAETDEFTPTVGWNTRNVITPTPVSSGHFCLGYRASSSSLKIRWYSTPLQNAFFGMPSTAGGALPGVFGGQAQYTMGGMVSVYATFGGNAAPTVQTAAAASANPVTTTTTALTVLGADDGGEGALTYTWAATSVPTGGAVGFSPNGTNSAKSSTATFTIPGSYTLRVTMTDVAGLTKTSSVTVTANVTQTVSTVAVAPFGGTATVNTSTQFTADVRDQYGAPVLSPTVSWSVSGGGTINSSGLFTGTTVGGPYTITATAGGKSNTAAWSVNP